MERRRQVERRDHSSMRRTSLSGANAHRRSTKRRLRDGSCIILLACFYLDLGEQRSFTMGFQPGTEFGAHVIAEVWQMTDSQPTQVVRRPDIAA